VAGVFLRPVGSTRQSVSRPSRSMERQEQVVGVWGSRQKMLRRRAQKASRQPPARVQRAPLRGVFKRQA